MKVQPQHLKRFWSKKNILFVSLFLILAISVGATFAYLTGYNGQKTYTFKGAYVDCEVHEDFDGTTKSNVKVENTGNTDAYIRATLVASWVKTENGRTFVHQTKPELGTNYSVTYGSLWSKGKDGYVYYYMPVKPNGFTSNCFDSVTEIGNPPAGYHLQVTVLAQALQVTDIDDGYNAPLSFKRAWNDVIGDVPYQSNKNDYQPRPLKPDYTEPSVDTGNWTIPVMSFNIRQSGFRKEEHNYSADHTDERDWYNREDDVKDYLLDIKSSANKWNMEIIGLQEVTMHQKYWLLEVPTKEGRTLDNYSAVYCNYDQDANYEDFNPNAYNDGNTSMGLMTLYLKSDYQLIGQDAFYLSDTPDKESNCFGLDYPRMCLVTLFKVRSEVLRVINVHMPHDQTEQGRIARKKSAELILKRSSHLLADHSILLGDFNCDAFTAGEEWYNIFKSQYADVLGGSHEKSQNEHWEKGIDIPTHNDLPLEAPPVNSVNGPIDFIFSKNAVNKQDGARIDTEARQKDDNQRFLSNHYAVTAEVSFDYIKNP